MRFSSTTALGALARGSARLGRLTSSSGRLVAVLALGIAASRGASAQFTNISAGLTGAENAIVWGDYNNSGTLDLLSMGRTAFPAATAFTDIYTNTSGTFSAASAGLTQIYSGGGPGKGAIWGDFDNDGDLDLLVVGSDGSGTRHAELYQNTGSGFTLVTIGGTGLMPVDHASAAWGDFDNDGDLDLFITGTTGSGTYRTTVYRNDGPSGGSWVFTDITAPITSVDEGMGAWGDYDNDGDLDLVVCGNDPVSGNPLTVLYKNTGGTFVNSGISLLGVRQGEVAWGDYDNDGKLDLIVSGVNASSAVQGKLYHNTGSTLAVTTHTVPAVCVGSLAWGDYNNDGNLDILATGNGGSALIGEVYAGNGSGGFSAISAGLPAVVNGQATWGDYNNDGKLDIAICGYTSSGMEISRVYKNNYSITTNTAPSAPTSLSTSATWHSITVSWSGASDSQTPASNLHYNIYVWDQTASKIIESPMANTSTGYRRVPALGNANHNTSWTIKGLQAGHTYSVCVQAIDGAFAGSGFNCADVTTPNNHADMMISDCSGDNGTEPSSCANSFYWWSPDIINRTSQGYNPVDQNPVSGQTNYVYVTLRNVGNATLGSGDVYLYWSKWSVGQGWAWSWNNCYNGSGQLIGDLIGKQTITGIGSGGTITLEFPWNTVPDPLVFHEPSTHCCLLARFVSSEDPMTTPEGTNVVTNVQNNNNIAMRNEWTSHGSGSSIVIGVGNPYPIAQTLSLSFAQMSGVGSLLEHGTMVVDLGSDLYTLWTNGGQAGTGVTPYSAAPGNTKVSINAPNASLDNLQFSAFQQLSMEVDLSLSYVSELAGQIYDWNVTETINGDPTPLDGGVMSIEMPLTAGGKRVAASAADMASVYELNAHPNPTAGSTTVSYTLPVDASVTIAIYDATGALVKTLVGGVAQARGAHQVEWNGANESGAQVPAGTYFYRLQAGTKNLEQQIKIVR